jgi:hypothetical protein
MPYTLVVTLVSYFFFAGEEEQVGAEKGEEDSIEAQVAVKKKKQ